LKANNDSVSIETQQGHKFILKQGKLTINTFADSANYSASLNHGYANLYDGNGREQITLNGNRCITYGIPNVLIEREKADPTIASDWTEGFFAQDQTLPSNQYFEAISRWCDVTVIFSNPTIRYSFEGHIQLQASNNK
jgi:hypothetical protein